MTIQNLYCEEKFNNIVYYLNECGFFSIEELQSFDFDELFFVPGISDSIVAKVKALYSVAIEKSIPLESRTREQNTFGASNPQSEACPRTRLTSSVSTEDIQQELAECATLMYESVRSIKSKNKLSEIREYVLTTENCDGLYPEILAGLCDDLNANIADSTADVLHSGKEYSSEEKERLLSAEVESVFAEVKRGSAMIRYCAENGIYSLWDLRNFEFSYKIIKGLGPDTAKACRDAYQLAVKNIINPVPKDEKSEEKRAIASFVEAYDCLKDNARSSLILKSQGQTLQEIGEKMQVTRERVRQIIGKTVRKLSSVSRQIVEQLMGESTFFYKTEIKKLFDAPELVDCFVYVLEHSETLKYFEFAEKYVDANVVPADFNSRLDAMIQELVGDAANYYDILEEVESALIKREMAFLDASDLMGYLFEKRYIAMGDYVIKKNSAYKRICYDAIVRHFKSGIKLDSNENNSDMQLMKEIICKEYAGFTLPDNNRAITARVSPELILCGRGRYCAAENVLLDEMLFNQIVDYINNSDETSLYYSEIFAVFSGRLKAETSVDNANYLHGALKYLYPDDFEYQRDLLVKRGMIRVTFGERLANAILSHGGPITKKELLELFPGVTDIRIVNAVITDPKLIQWNYNEFNHIDNLICTDDDIKVLLTLLERRLTVQKGYCSENSFYEIVQKDYPEFLEKNSINASLNLFYIVACVLGNEYRFSRPHIASDIFPDMELTNINVARFFVGERLDLQYQELVRISEQAGWSNGTFTIILNAIEEDYIKIALNSYIRRSVFSLDSGAAEAIKQKLTSLLSDSEYYGLFAIFNYD